MTDSKYIVTRYRMTATMPITATNPEATLKETLGQIAELGIFDRIDIEDTHRAPLWMCDVDGKQRSNHYSFSKDPIPNKPLSELGFIVALGVWVQKHERHEDPFDLGTFTCGGMVQSLVHAYRMNGVEEAIETAYRWQHTSKEESRKDYDALIIFLKGMRIGVLLGINKYDLHQIPLPILLTAGLCFEVRHDNPKTTKETAHS